MTFDMTPRPLNPAAKAPEMTWPNGARSALFIGFDVDAETAWIGNNPSNVDRMVTTSHGGYHARGGIAKILELMAELDLKGTVFTPCWTAPARPAQGVRTPVHRDPDGRTRVTRCPKPSSSPLPAPPSAVP